MVIQSINLIDYLQRFFHVVFVFLDSRQGYSVHRLQRKNTFQVKGARKI